MFNDLLLSLHVLGGAVGLLTMLVPLLSKKGGRNHRRVGMIFVVGMAIAGLTGLLIAGRFMIEGRTERGVFFGLLSILLIESIWSALSALRRKKAPEPSPRWIDRGLPATLGLAGIAGVLYAAPSGRWLTVGFAVLSFATGVGDYRFAARPLSSRMAWWYQHMNGMMAASITALTAFLVLNVQRIIGPLDAAIAWIPWVLPSAVIVPLFIVWIRRYKAKFGELG